jgi:hypothetical protein
MRSRIITAAVVTLGLVAVPSFVQADRAPQRTQTRVASHDTRTVTRDVRPVERDTHVVVRDEHVRRDNAIVRDDHRDVHVDERVIVRDGDRHWNGDRHWDRGVYVTPIVTAPVVVAPVVPCVTPVAISQVPAPVLDATAQRTGGAPIVSIDLVTQPGATFYDVHVAGAYNTVQTLRFGINGGFYGNV